VPTGPISKPPADDIPKSQSIISVLWPSFLTAAAATTVFFTLFDPQELAILMGLPELSRMAGYTGGFFAFWLLTSISSALTCYFRRPCNQISQQREPTVEQ
jgi:hypothetical protein